MKEEKSYKEKAVNEALDWIRDHYEDLLGFTEDYNEKLNFLKSKIKELYFLFDASTDSQDACYRVVNRQIDEALDKPLAELPPLLMENVSTGPRRVLRRLYYPEAGPIGEKKDG